MCDAAATAIARVSSSMTEHVAQFFEAIGRTSAAIDSAAIQRLAYELAALRERHERLYCWASRAAPATAAMRSMISASCAP
jgi:hypothetical protein